MPELKSEIRCEKGIAFIDITPDGRYIATAGHSWEAHLWDVENGALISTLEHGDSVEGIGFSPDGRLLASGDCDALNIWSIPDGKRLWQDVVEGPPIRRISFSLDGNLVSGPTWLPSAHVWQADTGKWIASLHHEKIVIDTCLNADGSLLATVDDDTTVHLWQVESGKEVVRKKYNHGIWRVGFYKRIHCLAVEVSGNNCWVHDVCADKDILQVRQTSEVKDVRLSPGGRYLAILGSSFDSGLSSIWDTENGQEVSHWKSAAVAWRSPFCSFSANDQCAAFGDRSSNVRVLQLPNADERCRISGMFYPVCPALTVCGEYLVTAGPEEVPKGEISVIRLWVTR